MYRAGHGMHMILHVFLSYCMKLFIEELCRTVGIQLLRVVNEGGC